MPRCGLRPIDPSYKRWRQGGFEDGKNCMSRGYSRTIQRQSVSGKLLRIITYDGHSAGPRTHSSAGRLNVAAMAVGMMIAATHSHTQRGGRMSTHGRTWVFRIVPHSAK